MKNLKNITALCTAFALITGCGTAAALPEETDTEDKKEAVQETSARAQDDFYRYINEDELKELEFRPGEDVASGAFDQHLVEDQVKDVIKEVAAGTGYEKGSEEDIIKTAYELFNAYDFENTPVPEELDSLLKEINDASSMDELLKIDAKLNRDYNIPNLFNIVPDDNYFSPGKKILTFSPYQVMPDAVFLDIEMKEMDGMETAKAIRRFSSDVPIIFLTSHTEMAMDGYEVGAFRFLKKPTDPEKLRETLRDLENRLKVEEKIVLRVDGEDVIYPISSLVYAEASNNSVRFVFDDENVTTRMKLADAIKLIDGLSSDFFKCHRSYYINLSHVYKLGTSEVSMDNGDLVPVSRGLATTVKQKLFEYIRRCGR